MRKAFSPQVVTANDLRLGDSVFLSESGSWETSIDESTVALNPESAEELLKDALKSEAANVVVGPYLIDVSLEETRPWPLRTREQLRLTGPSVLGNGLGRSPAVAARL